ncbi:MAG: hypothetical protein WCA19_01970 [Candidatus Acidiferrales bacterium]
MTPREYLENVVRPNIADLHNQSDSVRLACNAIATVDALAAYIFYWCHAWAPSEITGLKDDTDYRATLAQRNPDFLLLRDTAKAQKHVRLTRGKRHVTKAEQMSSRAIGWGEGPYGEGRFGGPPQVVIDTDDGNLCYVESLVDSALGFLESEMARLRI